MKKASARTTGPSAATLRELPEIDFSRYRVRRNRYARRIAREGAVLTHEEPSASSLVEIPEADLDRSKVRHNPYAERIAAGGVELQVGRGRPRQASEVGPTVTRSVRLPPRLWAALEERARAEGIAVHALIRRAILEILNAA